MPVDRLALQRVVAAALTEQGEFARRDAARADVRRALTRRLPQQVASGNGRHVDMQVYAVHQRAAEAALVTRHLVGRAAARFVGCTQVPAGAGVHCSDELETRREFAAPRSARDGDGAGFQGFTQGLQRGAGEFGQFVEEQDPMVGQRNFSRTRW